MVSGKRAIRLTDLLQKALRTADGFPWSPVVSFKRSAFNNGATKFSETVCRLACSMEGGLLPLMPSGYGVLSYELVSCIGNDFCELILRDLARGFDVSFAAFEIDRDIRDAIHFGERVMNVFLAMFAHHTFDF